MAAGLKTIIVLSFVRSVPFHALSYIRLANSPHPHADTCHWVPSRNTFLRTLQELSPTSRRRNLRSRAPTERHLWEMVKSK